MLVFTALVVTVFVAALVHMLPRWAHRIGLVDAPNGRKQHDGHVPLVGGIAMYFGVCVGMTLLEVPILSFPALVFGGVLLVLVGMLDDLRELRKRARFLAQVVAALVMSLVSGIVLRDLGALGLGEAVSLGLLAVPFTIFCTVGVVNAVNMSDGLDGLAGGLVLVTLGCLAYLAYSAGAATDLKVLVALMASVAGFLAFNARSPWCKKAKVFMGDAGSLFLGFALARFLIDFSQGDHRLMQPVTALWIFAVPLMDTLAVMMRRMAAGRSPFSADRQHLHHVLIAAGFSVGQAVALIWGLALVLAIAGIAGQVSGAPEGAMFWGFVGMFGIYVYVLRRIARAALLGAQAVEVGVGLSGSAEEGQSA